MLRKVLLKRLERKLKRCEAVGAITPEDCEAIRESARGADWLMIMEMIMMIMELIREWLENRD